MSNVKTFILLESPLCPIRVPNMPKSPSSSRSANRSRPQNRKGFSDSNDEFSHSPYAARKNAEQRRQSEQPRPDTKKRPLRSGQQRRYNKAPQFEGPDYAALTDLWQQWLDAQTDTPLPLDRWLKKHHSAQRARRGVERASTRTVWQANAAMMEASRFQQLACALEAQFRQDDEIDWAAWDKRWHNDKVSHLDGEAFWSWIGLRTKGEWLKSRNELRDFTYRERLYAALEEQALEQPLTPLWMIWHGLRPQWLPLLKKRGEISGWNTKQLQNFIKKQCTFPPLWLRAKPGADLLDLAEQLKAEGIEADTRNLNGEIVLAARGGRNVQSSELFKAGEIEIQDLASQHIAAAVAAKSGDKVWDACAGAGGKSLAIASAMNHKGVVVATDLHAFKLDELKKRAKRAQLQHIRTFTWDGEEALRLPAEAKRQNGFDWVLVDAPCTSAGTWRRNPDARWRFNPQDTQQLRDLQLQLLQHAAEGVRPAGKLVYATCSWQISENEKQVEAFLAANPQFELEEQCMLGAPDDDADCMFYARMIKKS